MDDFEAILTTVEIIDEEVDRLLNISLQEQRKKAPVTTPTKYEINAMIGSSSLYYTMETAVFNNVTDELSDVDISKAREIQGREMAERLSDAKEFRTYVATLIYHFLEVDGVELFPDKAPPLMKKRNADFIDHIRGKNFEWEGDLEDVNIKGVSQSTEFTNYSVIWIYFLPAETVSRAEERIESRLKSNGVRDELVDALKKFPEGLNRMTNADEDDLFFLLLEKFLQSLGELSKAEFRSFNRVFLHEITHDYLKKNTDSRLESRTVDEAFAQFTDKVYSKGLDFNHSPESYAPYREYYDNTDPENIWWMVEIIREKAKTLDLENEDYSLIDWARMTEAKLHEQGIDSRVDFLEHFTPEKIHEELREFNSIIHNEIRPLYRDIEENFIETMNRNHQASLEDQRELKKVIDNSKADIQRLEQLLSSPDKVLRRAEKLQIDDKSQRGRFKSILKLIEFYIASNNETLEYEQELIQDVINEEITEIKACIQDFRQLAQSLEEMDQHSIAQKLARDIRELEKVGENLQEITE